MLKKTVLVLLSFLLLFLSCQSSGSSGGSGSSRSAPAWVNSAESVFPRAQYVASTGFASTRVMAEANALAALTSFFGQTIEVDREASSSYRQAIVNGVMDGWIDTAEMRTNVRTSASFDNLMGVEIRDTWQDSGGLHYAVAVMNKQRAIVLYNESIRANINVINNLLTMTPNERNSLSGVIRLQFAAVVADMNYSYRNVVRLLDGTPPAGTENGGLLRLEAQNIIRTIPIGIRVENDRNGRLSGAFARSFSSHGFETVTSQAGFANSRYQLNATVNLSPVDLPGNSNVFARIELEAHFRDNTNGIVLIPHNFNSREGHTTRSEAENRCIMVAERNINETFAATLSSYLSSLYPRN